jgi:hypothetical protein
MPKLTIFSTPKPFTDPHIATIQRNAIRSWTLLSEAEVILVGDELGMTEVAAEFGVRHLPEVARNGWGTPLLSDIFTQARAAARSDMVCFVNADILLMPDLIEAVDKIRSQAEAFLLVGRRWNLDVTEAIDFSKGWVERLRERTFREGSWHVPAGSDYFVFPKALYGDMPAFAIGRSGWDNWTIFHARHNGWPTISATPDVMIVHQNHDYSHLPGGKPHYDQEESQENIRLARGPENHYTGYILLDTDRELRGGRIVRARPTLLRLVRRLELAVMPREKRGPRWTLTRRLRRLRRRLTR